MGPMPERNPDATGTSSVGRPDAAATSHDPEVSGPVRDATGVAKYRHEAIAVVLAVRYGGPAGDGQGPIVELGPPGGQECLGAPGGRPCVCVLAVRRQREPFVGQWSLPSGAMEVNETLDEAVRRHLGDRTAVRRLAHLEQLETLSDPGRDPYDRTVGTAYLGMVDWAARPHLAGNAAWLAVEELPSMAFDHDHLVRRALGRLRAKLSYTNMGFALAPREFTIAQLRTAYEAVLGHEVSATNLQRVLARRGQLQPTGAMSPSGAGGGRPAKVFRFTHQHLEVTDPFAVLKP